MHKQTFFVLKLYIVFNFKIVYNLNELNKLAEPNRVGYNFMGWTLDKENTKKFTDTSNTNLVSIDILNKT